MKLAFLGPAPPFRGGIVTYYAMLYRVLKERGHSVFWSSFRKQYPGFLFPGSEQEGETASWLQQPNRQNLVPWSPWSWWKAARDIQNESPDALIIKYWLPFFAPGFFAVAWLLRRWTNTRIIFLLDNVIAHEKYPFAGFLTRLALGQGHGYIAQSDQVRQDLFEVLPQTDPNTVITSPHPVYDFGAPGGIRRTSEQAREILNLPSHAHLVLFFGFIKPYKGVMNLIDSAHYLREEFGDDLHILIVGDIYGEKDPYVQRMADSGAAEIIHLIDGFVPDETVEDYFLAADLAVLPYISATQSGIIQIAYNYDLPVVTTDVGGLPEVVMDGSTGYIVPPENPQALAKAVGRFFREKKSEEFAANVVVEKSKYSWDRMAEAIESLATGNES